ncbi:hypothetical protein BDV95DRAFT_598177 [Massariosphaeria phaeospora]|uniref:Uncharacterized protein n=1 Tax=Massariosphaeria phaeospora TaxID=100035 RepID=A0A7C8MHX4_9PLEO|nr:hypothetical protein BDV95DRAFT_598177 [Massariosphaeria phaeospora]
MKLASERRRLHTASHRRPAKLLFRGQLASLAASGWRAPFSCFTKHVWALAVSGVPRRYAARYGGQSQRRQPWPYPLSAAPGASASAQRATRPCVHDGGAVAPCCRPEARRVARLGGCAVKGVTAAAERCWLCAARGVTNLGMVRSTLQLLVNRSTILGANC